MNEWREGENGLLMIVVNVEGLIGEFWLGFNLNIFDWWIRKTGRNERKSEGRMEGGREGRKEREKEGEGCQWLIMEELMGD